MIEALHVIKFSLKDIWEDFALLIVLNMVWSLASLLPIAPWLVLSNLDLIWVLALSFLLSLPLPIVSGALCFVTNQIARRKAADWRDFVIGLRRYWAKSLAVALVNLIALVLIVVNIQFYSVVLQGAWTDLAVLAWSVVGLYWLLVQVFWFPMVLELKSERLLVALRNALGMVIITPGFSLTLAIALVVLGAVCIFLTVPAVLVMSSLFLLIANHATLSRLAFVQKKPYLPDRHQDE